MKINQAGIDLIRRHEKCVLRAYQDPRGIWTIGWGHTGSIEDGDFWDQDKCDQVLVDDLANFERAVASYVTAPLNENQFSALVCFVFNAGAGAFYRSSALQRLNQRDYEGACKALGLYTKMRIKGTYVDSPELIRRRADEQSLFMASVEASESSDPQPT